MALPIPVILSALSIMQRQAQGKAVEKIELKRLEVAQREHDMAAQLEMKRLEVDRANHEQSLQAEDRRHQRDVWLEDQRQGRIADIAQTVIGLQSDVTKTKVEGVMMVFRSMDDMLRTHQKALIDEKARLSDGRMFSTLTPFQHQQIDKRQNEIDDSLEQLSEASIQLGTTAMSVVERIQPSIPPHIENEINSLGLLSYER